MRYLHRAAASLYPAWWRQRYGAEFDALLDDARPGLGGAFDIAKGALFMQITQPVNPLRVLLAATALGLIFAIGFAFAQQREYRATAVLSITGDPQSLPDWLRQLNSMANSVLSRATLTQVLRNHQLYRDLQRQMPLEDVIEVMRENIRVQPLRPFTEGEAPPSFDVSFRHADPATASAVVQTLSEQFVEQSQGLGTVNQTGEASTAPALSILDAARIPETPEGPDWGALLAMGIVGGIFLGVAVTTLIALTAWPVALKGFEPTTATRIMVAMVFTGTVAGIGVGLTELTRLSIGSDILFGTLTGLALGSLIVTVRAFIAHSRGHSSTSPHAPEAA